MIESAYEGKLSAFYIMGENPMLTDPNIEHTRKAFGKLDFLVVQDIFLTETAALADVVLRPHALPKNRDLHKYREKGTTRKKGRVEPPGRCKRRYVDNL